MFPVRCVTYVPGLYLPGCSTAPNNALEPAHRGRWADYRRPGEKVVRPPSARGSRVRACMFLTLLLLIALFTAEARAQQPAKVHQLGYLSSQSPVPANRV